MLFTQLQLSLQWFDGLGLIYATCQFWYYRIIKSDVFFTKLGNFLSSLRKNSIFPTDIFLQLAWNIFFSWVYIEFLTFNINAEVNIEKKAYVSSAKGCILSEQKINKTHLATCINKDSFVSANKSNFVFVSNLDMHAVKEADI